MKNFILAISILCTIASCRPVVNEHDVSGIFEADEVIVSSEVTGKILKMNATEGTSLSLNQEAAVIDTSVLVLQKEQVEASIKSLNQKTNDLAPYIQVLEQQLSVQQSQLETANHELQRIKNLIAADAATGKQLDDATAQVDILTKQTGVTRKQIIQQKSVLSTQNRGILSEQSPLEVKANQISDQMQRAIVKNPVAGTVLTNYAMTGEITQAGKALYKIADLSTIILRAYITGSQLAEIKLNQAVKVYIDHGAHDYRKYRGTITWISDKAEFTPKTIQTKDERANLVYAIKIIVKNDGYIKIGMYGEADLK